MSRWDKSKKDAIWTGVAAAAVGVGIGLLGLLSGGTLLGVLALGAEYMLVGGVIGGLFGAVTGGGQGTPAQISSVPSNARSAQQYHSQEVAQEQVQENTKFRDMVTNSRGQNKQVQL